MIRHVSDNEERNVSYRFLCRLPRFQAEGRTHLQARAMASPRVERRTRRRLPPTPSLPPGRRPEQPPGQTNDTSGGSRPSSTGVPRSAGPVCCRCKMYVKCMSCVCVKQGRVCTSCLPSRTGGCHNLAVPTCPPAPAVPNPAFASPTTPAPTTLAPPSGQLPPSGQSVAPPSGRAVAPPTLPPWDSVFSLRSSTLQHVLKGVRNAWAGLVSSVFSAINHNPLVLDNWRKLFLLPRCILANPPNGDRLGWRKLQGIVNLRIRKWQRGEILNLWEEFVSSTTSIRHRRGNGSKGVKGSSPESLRAINVRRSKLATRAGQYRKGIQALTSEGLAPTSESTLEIMRSNTLRAPLPPAHLLLLLRPSPFPQVSCPRLFTPFPPTLHLAPPYLELTT